MMGGACQQPAGKAAAGAIAPLEVLTSASSGSCSTSGSVNGGPAGSSGTCSSWRGRLSGWFGGHAGLPIDGWLTTCCSQVGQIMLTLPNAFSKVGLAAALPLSVGCACLSFWTMYCLIALYVERKQRLIKQGRWGGQHGRTHHVTQYHEVMGDTLGVAAKRVVQAVVVISLFGTNVSQIVASSSDAYYLGQGLNKRELALVFGGLMQLSVLLPSLRHFRIINIIGLLSTTYTAWYIVGTAAAHGVSPDAARGPPSVQDFYNGFAVIMSAFGGHAMALEIMDAMWVPEGYTSVYGWSFLYVFSLTLPHSTAVQVAWPDQAITNGNVYGILPPSNAKSISIYLMLLHQVIAFCLYSAPLYYMSEKLLGLHSKPMPWRILARLPVSLGVAAFAVAFPFYGTINAVVGALTSPLIAFVFPAAAYSWLHRTRALQEGSAKPPPRWMLRLLGGWWGVHALNALIIGFFLVNGTGAGVLFSVRQFVRDVQHFSVFPACFQC